MVEKRIPGFKLNWFLTESNGNRLTGEVPSRAEDLWKPEVQTPKFEQPIIAEMAQMARQLRMQNMTREQILDKVIRDKMENISILEEEKICWFKQIQSESLVDVFSKLVSLVDKEEMEEPAVTEEDVRTGFDIFQIIMYCPSPMVVKLFRFLDGLVSSETSRTIIQSSVNLFQSGVLKDMESFEMARNFYFLMASTFDLQYGNFFACSFQKLTDSGSA